MEKNNNGRKLIWIIAQAFYGNRTYTEISEDEIDRFLCGHIGRPGPEISPDTRVVINLPGTDNLVIVYNRNEEKKSLEKNRNDEYKRRPLAEITELDLKIYSRCIVCRLNAEGEFESLHPEDCKKFMKYLAR